MSALTDRATTAILSHADDLTLGGVGRKALVTMLGGARAYLSDAEYEAAGRPILGAVVPASDTTTAGSSANYLGRALTVKRAIDLRWDGATIARLLVLVG